MKTLDMTEVFKNYENKWIALDDNNQVIVSGNSLEEVLKLSRKKGFNDVITANIPDFDTEYVL